MVYVLVCANNFQEYIIPNIRNLLYLNETIYVLTNTHLFKHFDSLKGQIKLVSIDNYDKSYIENTKLDKNYRNGFWYLCSLRFYYLLEFLKNTNIKNVMHIENDVVTYYESQSIIKSINDTNHVYIPFDSPNRSIASILYIPSYEVFAKVMDKYRTDMNDMENFSNIRKTTSLLKPFPIFNDNTFISEGFEKFNGIFDAAAIGQYLGGVDPRNVSTDTRGFVNETCIINYSKYKIEFDSLNRPFIHINGIRTKIYNLHIHCKKVETFIIKPTSNQVTMISGEEIQELCDVYIGTESDFEFNPNINKKKCIDIHKIPTVYYNPGVIFCYTHLLSYILPKLECFTNPFVLVTHNSDGNIRANDPVVLKVLDHPLLVKWYAQNANMTHRKLVPLPIGIANKQWLHGQIHDTIVSHRECIKTRDVYFNFNIATNPLLRTHCYDVLKGKIDFLEDVNPNDNIKRLSTYKYCICPEGNGIDTHRFWEALSVNTIPICIKSIFTKQIKDHYGIPCVLLERWEDLDMDKLLSAYVPLNTNIDFKDILQKEFRCHFEKAVVVLTRGYTDINRYGMLVKRNQHIERHMDSKNTHVIICHEGNISLDHQKTIQRQTSNLNIYFVNVVSSFNYTHTQFYAPTRNFNIGYRNMCRFWITEFWKYFGNYDKIMRIDEDCIIMYNIDSVFSRLNYKTIVYGKWENDDEFVTHGLGEYVASTLSVVKKVNGCSGPYTNVIAFNINELKNNVQVQDLCKAIVSEDKVLIYRWGDLPVWGEIIRYLVDSHELNSNIRYYHGSHRCYVNKLL